MRWLQPGTVRSEFGRPNTDPHVPRVYHPQLHRQRVHAQGIHDAGLGLILGAVGMDMVDRNVPLQLQGFGP